MKKISTIALLAGICVLSVLIIQMPFAGMISVLFPGLAILASALVIFRRKLAVGGVILSAVLSLLVLPIAVYILGTVLTMLVMGLLPLWLTAILSCVLQYAVSLAVFAWICRILCREKLSGIGGIRVLVMGVLAVAAAVLDGASYGFVSELPEASVMEMMMFLSSRNPIFALLSQVVFYGAIFFMGYVLWRNVSGEDAEV